MNDATLQDRLERIERRQNLVLVLLVVPYLLAAAEFVSYLTIGIAGTVALVVAYVGVAVSRRRQQNAASR
ncbi:hypothetical protein [Halomarina rubra]|uniref:Uncharacterized protein n=1 Tax=Halomarina rubra TaxID=2071873 RepID=A0ABD6AUS0_9EURY|nr:hypothetical protein [Halomarina rubra]